MKGLQVVIGMVLVTVLSACGAEQNMADEFLESAQNEGGYNAPILAEIAAAKAAEEAEAAQEKMGTYIEAYVEEKAEEVEETVTTKQEPVAEKKPEKTVEKKEEAAPSLGGEDMVLEAHAEYVTSGEEYQVSSIMGTGTGSQTAKTMYYPAYTQVSPKGDIYFVDGDINNQKLRKVSNGRIETVVELSYNKINKTGTFRATGLAHMGSDFLIVSNLQDAYYIESGRVHAMPGDIPGYMEDHHLDGIWRMKAQGDKLYMLFRLRGYSATYHLAEYDFEQAKLIPIIERADYNLSLIHI